MKNRDLLFLAWRNLMRRKSRAFLTIFSVVVGIFSIVLMLSFGYGIQLSQENFLKSAVSLNAIELSEASESGKGRGRLDTATLEKLERDPRIEAVLGKLRLPASLEVKQAKVQIQASLVGVDFRALARQGYRLQGGRSLKSLNDHDFILDSKAQAVKKSGNETMALSVDLPDFEWARHRYFIRLGQGRMPGLARPKTPGEAGVAVRYAGRLESGQGAASFLPEVYVDLPLAQRIKGQLEEALSANALPATGAASSSSAGSSSVGASDLGLSGAGQKGRNRFDSATVYVRDMSEVEAVTNELKDQFSLNARAMKTELESAQQGMLVIQVVLGAIGGVALFVAAIGITNTMLMSIQERTKEIGVMKVIGAQLGDIRRLFLLEAAMIGVLGGLIGMGLSLLTSNLANRAFLSYAIEQGARLDLSGDTFLGISYIPAWLPFLAVLFSAFVGLLAGYLPARRATRLSAIEAIRTQ